MRALTRVEQRWFVAMVEAILPSRASEAMPFGAQDVPLGAFLHDFLRCAPFKIVLGLRATLLLIFLAPLFQSGLRRTFMGLDGSARQAAILRMRKSDVYVLRELPVLLKTIGCMAVLGVPQAQQTLGLASVDATPPDWARGVSESGTGGLEGAPDGAALPLVEQAAASPSQGG